MICLHFSDGEKSVLNESSATTSRCYPEVRAFIESLFASGGERDMGLERVNQCAAQPFLHWRRGKPEAGLILRQECQPFADGSLSPMLGRDTKGPTAVLSSVAKIEADQCYYQLLNQKFLPRFLEGENKEMFLAYLESWQELGIPHIQFNVVDRAALEDAQLHPDRHRNLVVRIAGYSAYFVDLSKGLQDSIIARTEQSFC